jgi:hypothetical protein
MFNPVNPPDVVLAIGRVLHEAADDSRPQDDYRRSQLLSAYSVARHLAAEQSSIPQLRSWFQSEVQEIAGAGRADDELSALSRRAAGALATSDDSAEAGAVVCDLLVQLRQRRDPGARSMRMRIQRLLRELTDREVAALADPPK